MNQQPPTNNQQPLTSLELIANARRMVETAASSSSREYDTVTALESQVQWEGVDRADVTTAIRALLNSLGDLSSCRGCGNAIWWIRTKKGAKAPYTAAAINHFADCPKSTAFRRQGAKR